MARIAHLHHPTPDCTTGHRVDVQWSDGTVTRIYSRAAPSLRVGMTRAQAIAAVRQALRIDPTRVRECADVAAECVTVPRYPSREWSPWRMPDPARVCVG